MKTSDLQLDPCAVQEYISEDEFIAVLLSDDIVVQKFFGFNLATKRALFVLENKTKVKTVYIQSISADGTVYTKYEVTK